MVRAILGGVFGAVFGLCLFVVLHFNQLVLVGQQRAGLIVTMQLNQSVDLYLFGGIIMGVLLVIAGKNK